MNQIYSDILDKLGEPQWFDECAVPRYCKFEPNAVSDIYAHQVALVEIACQPCEHLFLVAFSWGMMDNLKGVPSLKERITAKELHYGDPPNVACCMAGATMNSVPHRVVEFWDQPRPIEDWKRLAEYEIEIEPQWWTEGEK